MSEHNFAVEPFVFKYCSHSTHFKPPLAPRECCSVVKAYFERQTSEKNTYPSACLEGRKGRLSNVYSALLGASFHRDWQPQSMMGERAEPTCKCTLAMPLYWAIMQVETAKEGPTASSSRRHNANHLLVNATTNVRQLVFWFSEKMKQRRKIEGRRNLFAGGRESR